MKSLLLIAAILATSISVDAAPKITGTQIHLKSQIIDWPKTWSPTAPNLHGGANQLNDINLSINDCDLVISTAGNYNAALSEYMRDVFLSENDHLMSHGNVLWTTSPPVSVGHTKNGGLRVGSFDTSCIPTVAIGPKKLMVTLASEGLTDGTPIPVIKNYGNVIVVKKGNPCKIFNVFDLANGCGRLVTSDGRTEKGSFGNFSGSIYNIAQNQAGTKAANDLFNKIYNNDTVNGGDPNYVSWGPIMHRGIPQAIKDGFAVAGVTFRHLGKQWSEQFPGEFEVIPLGGTVDEPNPLIGNKVATLFIVKIRQRGDDDDSSEYSEEIIEGYLSDEFTDILIKHGLRRP